MIGGSSFLRSSNLNHRLMLPEVSSVLIDLSPFYAVIIPKSAGASDHLNTYPELARGKHRNNHTF